MEIFNFEQGGGEWFEIRKGKMTASNACKIGNCGAGLNTYVLELMAEYFSSADKEHYTNEHMERGKELEAEARLVYKIKNKVKIEEVAFIMFNEYIGCSPDGLVNKDGLIEIKCPSDKVYLGILLGDKIKSEYYWQIQMQLYITKRKWCDYMVYNPNFEVDYVIERILPDEKYFAKLEQGFQQGSNMIEEIKRKLKCLTNK